MSAPSPRPAGSESGHTVLAHNSGALVRTGNAAVRSGAGQPDCVAAQEPPMWAVTVRR
jgi:hypothetical protein